LRGLRAGPKYLVRCRQGLGVQGGHYSLSRRRLCPAGVRALSGYEGFGVPPGAFTPTISPPWHCLFGCPEVSDGPRHVSVLGQLVHPTSHLCSRCQQEHFGCWGHGQGHDEFGLRGPGSRFTPLRWTVWMVCLAHSETGGRTSGRWSFLFGNRLAAHGVSRWCGSCKGAPRCYAG
jgi:hypothetical protein